MNENLADSPVRAEARPRQRTMQYALVGIGFGILFPILASIIKIVQLGLPLGITSLIRVQMGEPLLWITDTAPLFLGIVAGIAGRRQDLVLQANQELTQRDAELRSIRENLEQSVSDRTRELDERNAQMRLVVAFARQIADVQDLSSLLAAAVNTIAERFGRYHADLFLVDERGEWAVLRASSSPAGQRLLAEGHRIAIGDQNVVGRVARRGKLISLPVRAGNPDLGERAAGAAVPQIALPLVVRGKVIGVLVLHSQERGPVGQSEAEVFQLLADQLAASIENARLATQARATVAQLEAVTSHGTRLGWQEYLKSNEIVYQFTPAGVHRAGTAATVDPPAGLRVPLMLRGQEIGRIVAQKRGERKWSAEEQDLIEKVAAQVALALENARLLEDTRRRAAQEQVIGEASARFSRSIDVDTLLRAAVREFAALPEVAEATVLLQPAEEPGPQGSS